jgi:hypothetical protein
VQSVLGKIEGMEIEAIACKEYVGDVLRLAPCDGAGIQKEVLLTRSGPE